MVNGVNGPANDIFSTGDNIISRTNSKDGSVSESELKGLSDKDAKDVTSIKKDELEYQINGKMADQKKELEKEE